MDERWVVVAIYPRDTAVIFEHSGALADVSYDMAKNSPGIIEAFNCRVVQETNTPLEQPNQYWAVVGVYKDHTGVFFELDKPSAEAKRDSLQNGDGVMEILLCELVQKSGKPEHVPLEGYFESMQQLN